MSIQGSYVFKSVSQLYRERELQHFDNIVQRDYVWKDDAKSLFIHSMLYGYPFPPVYALVKDVDGREHLDYLDGKQRLDGAVFDFLDNKYAISRGTPEFNGVKLVGKYYKDLPVEFQELILGTMFQIYQYRNLTHAEIRELFSRLNNSVPLSKFEKVRIWVPQRVAEVVREVKNQLFFQKAVNIGAVAKKRFVDEEVIFQILLLLRNDREAIELNNKTVRRVITEMKETTKDDEMFNILRETTDYLGKALPERVSELSKVHIPPVFIIATYAVERKTDPEKFAIWMDGFFSRNSGLTSAYGFASIVGQTNKTNVQKRLDVMKRDFDANIDKPRQLRSERQAVASK